MMMMGCGWSFRTRIEPLRIERSRHNKSGLAGFRSTVVRIETVNSPGKMLRETLMKKPMFKISFVLDPADPNSPAVAVDFALSQSEAELNARSSLPLHRARGATGWRIIGRDDGQVAIGAGNRLTLGPWVPRPATCLVLGPKQAPSYLRVTSALQSRWVTLPQSSAGSWPSRVRAAGAWHRSAQSAPRSFLRSWLGLLILPSSANELNE